MKKYKLVKFSKFPTILVDIFCSDPEVIDWFENDLKLKFPNIERYYLNNKKTDCDLNGKMIRCLFKGFDGKDAAVSNWIIQKLLELGYEPFTVDDNYMWYRLEINE